MDIVEEEEEEMAGFKATADLDYSHMICDQILGKWIDVNDYPADQTSVSIVDQSDFKCAFELY